MGPKAMKAMKALRPGPMKAMKKHRVPKAMKVMKASPKVPEAPGAVASATKAPADSRDATVDGSAAAAAAAAQRFCLSPEGLSESPDFVGICMNRERLHLMASGVVPHHPLPIKLRPQSQMAKKAWSMIKMMQKEYNDKHGALGFFVE